MYGNVCFVKEETHFCMLLFQPSGLLQNLDSEEDPPYDDADALRMRDNLKLAQVTTADACRTN